MSVQLFPIPQPARLVILGSCVVVGLARPAAGAAIGLMVGNVLVMLFERWRGEARDPLALDTAVCSLMLLSVLAAASLATEMNLLILSTILVGITQAIGERRKRGIERAASTSGPDDMDGSETPTKGDRPSRDLRRSSPPRNQSDGDQDAD